MPFNESIQHKLGRVRPPRVQITYDVQVGDAVEEKELPLVVGILADLAGQREELPRLRDRKFTEIDKDNFDKVMEALGPKLVLKVADKLNGNDSRMEVELKFTSIDSFHPKQLIEQIEPLRQLLERRQRLVDLMAKLDGNDALMERLQSLLAKKDELERLESELKAEQKQ
ncbi:type VI secretion system contractile sheath small subunit [Archangium lansingense]|uniref:Type VI secretion system contractile sheath small subunit n=1 Tax=Archangium lansingense TaxID=2995310 RepID=A0ABT4AEC3_9BACT|nr:type VI secretion system contractile sheath small subunit [Archangium lansinium]MCY1080023.1 type VI secretion system contractile sheath small subunit [Archangium lansinium]